MLPIQSHHFLIKIFVITTALRKTNSDTKFTADSQVYINNRGNTYINNQGVYVPAYRPSVSYTLYNWYAIKIYINEVIKWIEQIE